ncbi:MAG: ABC transporter ATP-binding protein [Dehalococcoidales bacterium]|nr:MAG: ABC transporter ATP-binding protein [Dehalococcoidales bacterium]
MLEVKDLCVQMGKFFLKNVSLEVRDGEYFVLVGPTGSGKSVLLESIAGLTSVTSGEVWINDRDVTDLNLEKRNIGFAFQDYALYRHLSVRDNISFGLMWKHQKQKDINKAVDRAVELLHLENLLDKRSWTLSGGESQKIALARAIAIKPDLLILDEPLSSVDAETKEDYERELRELHNQLELTTIHVTHSFEEAVALGDRIAVIIDGEILQVGTPEEIFLYPQSEKLARFLMTRNVFSGEITRDSNGNKVFTVDGTRIIVNTELEGRSHISIRPENILLSKEPVDSPRNNCIEGTVRRIVDRGTITHIKVDVPPEFTCLALRRTMKELDLTENDRIYLTFEISDVNVFRQD